MSGTQAGAIKSTKTIRKKYGKDFHKTIGSLGGKAQVPKGFALNGNAVTSGKLGGQRSSRKGIKNGQGVSRSALYKNTGSTIGPLRIEKPKWYQFAYKRQLRRLGIHQND